MDGLTELWRPTVGYERLYEVSDLGRVRTTAGVLKKLTGNKRDGYLRVSLWKENRGQTVLVHRLVLFAFRGPCPRGMEARHLNGVRTDPRLANLEWGTPTENAADRIMHGTQSRGEKNGAHLSEQQVTEIRLTPMPDRHWAEKFGVSWHVIKQARNGQRWAHISVAPITLLPKKGPMKPKLTAESVRLIRQSQLTDAQLGLLLNVDRMTVKSARIGRTWAHVK